MLGNAGLWPGRQLLPLLLLLEIRLNWSLDNLLLCRPRSVPRRQRCLLHFLLLLNFLLRIVRLRVIFLRHLDNDIFIGGIVILNIFNVDDVHLLLGLSLLLDVDARECFFFGIVLLLRNYLSRFFSEFFHFHLILPEFHLFLVFLSFFGLRLLL